MYHYVYKIVFETGHCYYGARTSKVPPEEDVKYTGTPYTYKEFWELYSFKKFILSEFKTKDEALDFEASLIEDFWKTWGKEKSLNANLRNKKFTRLGIKHKKEICEKIAAGRSRSGLLISPDGKIVEIPNLYLFCKNKGFSRKEKRGFLNLLNGYYPSYKGWTSNFKNYLFLKYYGSYFNHFEKPFKIKHTRKGIFTVYGRSKFAREHNINRSSLAALYLQKIKYIKDRTNKEYMWELA